MSGWQMLLYKEVLRFWKVAFQTIAAPVLTSVLYMLIFGHVLEDHVKVYDQVAYTSFLLPGLIMMGVLQNAFANSSSSLVQSKIMGNLVFLLLTPLTAWHWFLAYVLSSRLQRLISQPLIRLAALAMEPFVHFLRRFRTHFGKVERIVGVLLPVGHPLQPMQPLQLLGVGHAAAHDFGSVLDQDGGDRVLEDDVVLGIAFGELLLDLGVEVVGGVLRLPVAKGNAEVVQDGAIGTDGGLLVAGHAMLGKEDQTLLTGPRLQHVLEGFADDLFGKGAGEALDAVKVRQVGVDQYLGQRKALAQTLCRNLHGKGASRQQDSGFGRVFAGMAKAKADASGDP